jgi:hypothetical protein
MPDPGPTNTDGSGGDKAGEARAGKTSARAAGDATKSAQSVGERTAGGAASAGSRATQAGGDAAQQTAQSGVGTAAEMTERMADQFRQAFAAPGNSAEGAAQQVTAGMQAIVACTTTLAQGLQEVSREFMQQGAQRSAAGLQELQSSRSPQDVVAAQNRLARESLESMFALTRRLSEIMIAATDAAASQIAAKTTDENRK